LNRWRFDAERENTAAYIVDAKKEEGKRRKRALHPLAATGRKKKK